MQLGIIIQARTGSTRLPNKMLLPFYGDKGIFEIILSRISKNIDSIPVIVATTQKPEDNVIAEITADYGFSVYRGDEQNVLSRFIEASEHYKLDTVVRICADNPFLDLKALDYQLKSFEATLDYWCYSTSHGKPTIKTGMGFWTEMVSADALKKIASFTEEPIFLEHVTNYIYSHPEAFKIHFEHIALSVEKMADLRLTVDTEADFKLLSEIYAYLVANNIEFTASEIAKQIETHPQWLRIMRTEALNNIK